MTTATWRKIYIQNKNSLSLAALLREAALDDRNQADSASFYNNALVVVCHGFTGSKEGRGHALKMGDELAALGFSTLLFDFAGCGESEGNWEDLTLTGQIRDLASVVKWCRGEGFSRIILTGRSFGGSTVIGYASRDKQISAICTWAAVARPDLFFSQFIDDRLEGPAEDVIVFEGAGERLELKRGFFQDLYKHNLLECTAAISPSSLLVIHGSSDESVPCKDAELIYNTALEPKKIVIVEGADHRFSNHVGQVWDVFFKWLKTLPPILPV